MSKRVRAFALSESARKRQYRAAQRRISSAKISLLSSKGRWDETKAFIGLDGQGSDEALAMILLDFWYENHTSLKEPEKDVSAPSTNVTSAPTTKTTPYSKGVHIESDVSTVHRHDRHKHHTKKDQRRSAYSTTNEHSIVPTTRVKVELADVDSNIGAIQDHPYSRQNSSTRVSSTNEGTTEQCSELNAASTLAMKPLMYGKDPFSKAICIGKELRRWHKLKLSRNNTLHEEVAKFLLDLYESVCCSLDTSLDTMALDPHQNSEYLTTTKQCAPLSSLSQQANSPARDNTETNNDLDCVSDESSESEPSDIDSDWSPNTPPDKDWSPPGSPSDLDSDSDDSRTNYEKKIEQIKVSKPNKKNNNVKLHFTSTEENPDKFQCRNCEAVVTKDAMLKHWNTDHKIKKKNKSQKKIEDYTICPFCGKVFGAGGDVRSKKNIHTHIKRVHCSEYQTCPFTGCGKEIKVHALTAHLSRHSKDRLCTYCGRAFGSTKDLKSHENTVHCKARDFICTWQGCEKAFKSKKNLSVHLRIHTDTKPLQCDRCEYSCRQRAAMNWHVKKHHGAIITSGSYAHSGLGRPPKNHESVQI